MDDEYKIKRELASRNCIFEFNEILNFKAELEILKKVENSKWLEIKPDNFDDYYFDTGINSFDVYEYATRKD